MDPTTAPSGAPEPSASSGPSDPSGGSGASGPLGLGAAAKVIHAPGAAFRAVAADPQWVGPVLVCFVLAVISGWLMLPVSLEYGRDMALSMMDRMDAPEEVIEEQLADMPDPDNPDGRAIAQQVGGQIVWIAIAVLLGGAVVHLVARLLGGGAGFRGSLSLVSVATVIASVAGLARALLVVSTGTMEVSFGLPALLGLDYNSLPAILLDLLDPFMIWFLVVLGIGVSVVHGISRGAGFGAALVWCFLASIPLLGLRIMAAWAYGAL